jgi:hypothetical protein
VAFAVITYKRRMFGDIDISAGVIFEIVKILDNI